MKSPLLFSSGIFLFLVLLVAPVSAATSTSHPGSVPVLLGLDSVRKELELTKGQGERLDKIRSDFKADSRLITAHPLATSSEKAAANTTVRSLIARYNKKALAVLTPSQQARLVQIERQILGGLMLFQADEQKLLRLTSDQVATLGKLQAHGETYASRITNSFEKGELTLQDRLTALRKYRVKQTAKCLQVLTQAQRATFLSLQGKLIRGA